MLGFWVWWGFFFYEGRGGNLGPRSANRAQPFALLPALMEPRDLNWMCEDEGSDEGERRGA